MQIESLLFFKLAFSHVINYNRQILLALSIIFVIGFTTKSKAQVETDIISYSFAEQTSEAVITSNIFDIGLTSINTSSFLSLNTYAGGTHYLKRIGLNTLINTADVNNIEIRFGQGTQKAHRFTIPAGSGSGVAVLDYTYQDYIDVPFQVWDVDNDKQLMVSFRDQKEDGVFNLIEFNAAGGNEANHSREYIFIHNIDYASSADVNLAVNGGQEVSRLYFLWPYLTSGGTFNANNLPVSTLAIEVAHSTVAAKVTYGIDLSALVPTITIDANSSVSPISDLVNDFTEPRIYKVTAQDGVSFEKYLVNLTYGPNPVNESDSLVLIDLYNSTNGANWSNTWNLSSPVSDWHGVTVTDGRVTSLEMHNNLLKGNIPSSLGDLSALTLLGLFGNQLDGTIPIELGNLTNLVVLYLSDNQLTGSIPATLGNLSELSTLAFQNNNLTGEIPKELGNLTNIRSIWFADNQLTGPIFAEIWQLSKLEELAFQRNDFSGTIPEEVANLSSLTRLYLDDNPNLSGSIPNSITELELNLLSFSGTMICEPSNAAYQTWKSAITDYQTSGIACDIAATDFEAFSIIGQTSTSTLNATTHTVDIEVAFGTDITDLISTFTLSSGSTAKVGTTTQVSGTTTNNFTNAITYSITAEDGTTVQDWVVTIASTPNAEANIITFNFDQGNMINDHDGNVYPLVPIGSQLWMANNLKTASYNDGATIPLVISDSEWATLSTGAYSWFENNEADNKDTFGALYNWYSVETNKLCPSGWRVPSDNDWSTLGNFLGGNTIAGGKMKATGTEFWNAPNTAATNESGFSGLPGSNRVSGGVFSLRGPDGDWWTSTEKDAATAYPRNLQSNTAALNVALNGTPKDFGFSVRCVQAPTNNQVNLVVAYGTDIASLVPTIILSANASIDPGIGVAQDFTNPVTYTVSAEDGTTQDWIVTVTIAPSNETDIIGFSITEQTGEASIDVTNHTIELEAVYGTNLVALIPTISLSLGATIDPKDQESQDFTNPVTYAVTAEDGTTTQDWIVTVTIGPSNETDIVEFSIIEQTGDASINATNHIIDIEVDFGTNLAALIPTITLSEGATVDPKDQEGQDFTNPVIYTVTAEDGITIQQWVINVTVTAFVLGFEDQIEKPTLYPNPVNQQLVLNLGSLADKLLLVSVSDLSGKEIESIQVTGKNEIALDVTNYDPGVYFVSVQLGKKRTVLRFIKN